MYPGGNNNNNFYPFNINQPPIGFNDSQQIRYPIYPGQNSTGLPIGFNVNQPEYHQQHFGYQQSLNPSGCNQIPNMPSYQSLSNFDHTNQQTPICNQEYYREQPACQNTYSLAVTQSSGYSYPFSDVNSHQKVTSDYAKVYGQQEYYPSENPVYMSLTSQSKEVCNAINVESIGSCGEIYKGTIKPFRNFNAEQDCNVLRKAMKGIGTDEKTIIECLGRRCNNQRLEIKKTFKTMFGKDLIDELKSELSGDFSRAVIESLYDHIHYDAYSLRKAMEGVGTRENVLTEILTSRSNEQIENIKSFYKKLYNRDLEKDIISETSGFYKRVLVSCLQANKKELNSEEILMLKKYGPSSIINTIQAKQEASELYNAGEKKLGTDEACFIKIFALRNKYQLKATFDEYKRIVGHDIFTSIEREMSGDLASVLKAIAMQVTNSPLYFATRLYKSMKGAGTNDSTLIRILLTRSEIDLENIKMEFQKKYGKTLDHYVRSDTSGDYRKFLLCFVEGN